MTVTSDKNTDDESVEPADETSGAEEILESGAEESDTEETDAAEQTDALAEFTGAGPERKRRTGAWLLASVAVLIFVAALALSGFLGWKLWQKSEIEQAGQQARAAADSYAQVLTSIDSNRVDENFDQVLAGATGEFKDMYSQSSMQLRQLLIDNKASAHGVVVESAVQSATRDTVVVLLFVDQSVSNTQVPDPRIDRSRIKMTMQKVDGKWLTSKVELA